MAPLSTLACGPPFGAKLTKAASEAPAAFPCCSADDRPRCIPALAPSALAMSEEFYFSLFESGMARRHRRSAKHWQILRRLFLWPGGDYC